ncbi:UNVERIFIED_CONTAM: Retrovirus-related Pol polyprotein from transposon RE1 [Sesamum radiatum]|uniref:Retrovirus-related Pol polyprotein from transposon RE1 n=1 Tax=Sesamum radiatum TaxID=300843 RepID=A0AAW2NRT0_SESRA
MDVKRFLDMAFTIKDMGHAQYFLGLEFCHSPAGLTVSQHRYTRDIIRDVGLASCKPAKTPLPLGVKFSAHTTPLEDPGPYRRLVGRHLYLSFTWPDIAFGAQQLSQYVHQPGQEHLDAALHLVRYLTGDPK